MRENIAQQPPLVACAIVHPHADELSTISAQLRGLRGAAARVTADLQRGVQHKERGRPGLSGEQVLRMLVLKQLTGFSYTALAFHLADSSTYRRFCQLGIDGRAPGAATLQANIKRVQPATLEWINQRLLRRAQSRGLESGQLLRVDSTAVETNIHHPNDSSLLFDGVRVLSRLVREASELVEVEFSDHTRRAKRRALQISNAKKMAARVPLYRDLLKVTGWTLAYAHEALLRLARLRRVEAVRRRSQLSHYVELVARVMDQTQRRVLLEENVPAEDKVVSLFEPHTDILVKGGREVEYGHKAFVSTGRSGLIVDVLIERGNPADSTLTVPMVQRHKALFGRVPEQATFDAGFASSANQQALMDLGVKETAFAKNSAFDVMRSVSSRAVHRTLQRSRAAIEATISWLKRSFGMRRCTWSGFESFRAYAWASVLAVNLLSMARLSSA